MEQVESQYRTPDFDSLIKYLMGVFVTMANTGAISSESCRVISNVPAFDCDEGNHILQEYLGRVVPLVMESYIPELLSNILDSELNAALSTSAVNKQQARLMTFATGLLPFVRETDVYRFSATNWFWSDALKIYADSNFFAKLPDYIRYEYFSK